MHTLLKSLRILNHKEKKRGVVTLLIAIAMAFFDIIGIASVMPFLTVLATPDVINENFFLQSLFDFSKLIGIRNIDQFLIFLGINSFLIIMFSTIYRSYAHYFINRYIEEIRHRISLSLLNNFLKQNYEFFLNRNSSQLTKEVLSETDQIVGMVYRPSIYMLVYFLVFIGIFIFLVIQNPVIAILSSCVFALLYFIIYILTKSKFSPQVKYVLMLMRIDIYLFQKYSIM